MGLKKAFNEAWQSEQMQISCPPFLTSPLLLQLDICQNFRLEDITEFSQLEGITLSLSSLLNSVQKE